ERAAAAPGRGRERREAPGRRRRAVPRSWGGETATNGPQAQVTARTGALRFSWACLGEGWVFGYSPAANGNEWEYGTGTSRRRASSAAGGQSPASRSWRALRPSKSAS